MIGQFLNITSGFAFKSANFNDQGVGMPIIRIRDVGQDQSATFFDGEYDESYIIKKGDFLVGMDGEFRLAEWNGPDSLLNQRVCKLEPDPVVINRRYFYHVLPAELKRIEDTTSFVTVKHLSVKKIKEIKIPLPPLATQKKIAAILDAADAYRQKTKYLLAKYDELAQSIFLEMFGDPFSGHTEPLKNNISITGGFAFKSADFVETGIPLIKIGTVNKGYFDLNNFSFLPGTYSAKYSKWIIKPGDLLISLTGTVGKDDYGNVEVATSEYEEYLLNQRVAKIEPKGETYLKEFLPSLLGNKKSKKELTKISRGVRQANISNRDIENLKMITPTIENQIRYIGAINSIQKQKCILVKQSFFSENLFNSLLQKAFKGELVK